jgi:predicted DNA-binding ribbon-helix-helix protein
VADLVREIGAKRQHSNFSSELRLFVLEFYRKQGASQLSRGKIIARQLSDASHASQRERPDRLRNVI